MLVRSSVQRLQKETQVRSILSRFKKLPKVPDRGQRVRLLSTKGKWLSGYRAISYPVTDETGEGAIWVATEDEFWEAQVEKRPAVGELWPVSRLKVPKHYQRWSQQRLLADTNK